MKDVLSQEEIDALLEQVISSDGGASAGPAVLPGVRSYDLSGQQRITRGRYSGLDAINQRMSSRIRQELSGVLRKDVDIDAQAVSVRKFSDYLDGLYLPSSLNLMSLSPLKGTAMIVLDARLVFRIVDFFFGGSGRHAKVEGREFTPTENALVSRLLERMYRDIEDLWRGVVDVSCQPQGTEYNPALAGIVAPNDNVVISTFQVLIGAGGGEIHLVMPEAMLEPVRENLEAGSRGLSAESDRQWAHAVEQQLSQVMVNARCRVAELELSLNDIAALQVGDFLPLNLRRGSELTVDGIPIHRVQAGSYAGNWAVKVLKNEDAGVNNG